MDCSPQYVENYYGYDYNYDRSGDFKSSAASPSMSKTVIAKCHSFEKGGLFEYQIVPKKRRDREENDRKWSTDSERVHGYLTSLDRLLFYMEHVQQYLESTNEKLVRLRAKQNGRKRISTNEDNVDKKLVRLRAKQNGRERISTNEDNVDVEKDENEEAKQNGRERISTNEDNVDVEEDEYEEGKFEDEDMVGISNDVWWHIFNPISVIRVNIFDESENSKFILICVEAGQLLDT